jgi:hypothetical protein
MPVFLIADHIAAYHQTCDPRRRVENTVAAVSQRSVTILEKLHHLVAGGLEPAYRILLRRSGMLVAYRNQTEHDFHKSHSIFAAPAFLVSGRRYLSFLRLLFR